MEHQKLTNSEFYECSICAVRRGSSVRHYEKSVIGSYHREILLGLKEPTCPTCHTKMEFERWKKFPFCDKCTAVIHNTTNK